MLIWICYCCFYYYCFWCEWPFHIKVYIHIMPMTFLSLSPFLSTLLFQKWVHLKNAFLSFFCAIEIFVRFFDYKNYFEAWTKSCSIEKPKTTSSHRNGSRVSSADQPNQRMTDHYEQQQQQQLRRMWNRNHLSGHFETITRTKLTTYSMLTDRQTD